MASGDPAAARILDGLNPERMLVAAEALGIGRAALRSAVRYGNEREVFGRPIGMNQGLQFPLADSLARLDAAELVLRKATWLYDNGLPCAKEANSRTASAYAYRLILDSFVVTAHAAGRAYINANETSIFEVSN